MSRYDDAKLELRASPRRWLVTGGAGFIGSHLVETLLALGQEVVALDDLSSGYRHNLEDAEASAGRTCATAGLEPGSLRFVEGDVCDSSTLDDALAGVRHVLHQAAVASVPRSIDSPHLHHQANTVGFFRLLEAIRSSEVESTVYASSSSVYGDHPALPKLEDEVGKVLSPYAATKAANELYAQAWAHVYGMPIRGLRYFNVCGGRQDPEGAYAAVIPRWLAALAEGERPVIFGDGETSRDFCPVSEAVQMNLLAALVPPTEERVFNVSLGRRTTLNELFSILRAGMAARGVKCADMEAEHADFRPGDIRHSLADTERARRVLGYEPTMTRDQGFAETIAWFSSRLLSS